MTAVPSLTVTGTAAGLFGNLSGGTALTETALYGTAVTFVSNVPADHVVVWDGRLERVPPVVGYFAPDGTLKRNGDPVKLLANDPGLNVTGLQWTCIINGIEEFTFDADDDVDLSSVVNVPNLAVVGTPFTEASIIALLANSSSPIREALDALYGADGAITFAKLNAALVVTSGETIAANSNDTTVPTSAAVSSAVAAKYTKPGSGIPATDFASAVQTSLGKADSAVQTAAMNTAITTAVNALIGGAPGALDTLKELADAINDDASFAASITTALGLKLATSAVVDNTDGTGNVGSVLFDEPLTAATAIVTAATAPAVGKITLYNVAGGSLNVPILALSGLRVGSRFAVRRDPADTSPNTLTFTLAGSDTFYSSGATTFTLPIAGEQREFQVIQVGGTKYLTPAGSLNPLTGLYSRLKFDQPWWDTAFAPPSADDTPTLTVATSSVISSGTTVAPTADMADAHFRYDGCISVSTPGAGLVTPDQPSAAGAAYVLVPEFVTSQGCDKVDVIVKTNSAGTTMGVRITINGAWLTLPLSWFTTTANTTYYLRLVFPTAKARTIRVETVNVGTFGGVVVPSGETTTRPAREIQKRLVILGDSYVSGANGNSTTDPTTNGCSRFETFANYVAKLLGCDSVINLGIGGTGWVTVGSWAAFGARISDVLAASPHIVIAAGSRNDSTSTAAAVYAAAVAAMSQFSDIPVVEVCGIEDVGSTTGTVQPAPLNEAVKQAARTVGRRFNDMLNIVSATDKNSSDLVHPSVVGAQKLAKAFYSSLDRTLIDGTVAAAVGGRSSTDLTLAASPAGAANVGATITLTATQSTQRAGKVVFYANSISIGTATVASGVATMTTSSLTTGSYVFTARFIPSNPLQVKPATANPVSYNVSANLGFVDHFTTAGALTATENGKTYLGDGGTGTCSASGGVAVITVSAGTKYFSADAGTPNGTYSVTLGGTNLNNVVLPLRHVDGSNTLRLFIASSQITLGQVVTSTATTLGTGSTGVWVAGDVISVIFAGDTITVQKNGTNVTGLVGLTVSQFDTATKFGIGANATGPTFDDLTFA